jgi:Mrp family chromosome partitioning ATPase
VDGLGAQAEQFAHALVARWFGKLAGPCLDADFILLEGAPLSGFTDTKELAKYADGIIGIFSASLIIKHSDKESIKFFKTVPDKFIGAVLNKISSEELEIKK